MTGRVVWWRLLRRDGATAGRGPDRPNEHTGRGPDRPDDGVTLIELVISMGIMAICMAIFGTGLIGVFRAATGIEASSTAQGQLNLAFLRLDKQVRYASGISKPATVDSDYYVEWLTTYTGTSICTELRLDTSASQLQQRTWTQGDTDTMTDWVLLATEVGADTPFTYVSPTETYSYQRLTVSLTATSGANSTAVAKTSSITFTAPNTSLSTDSSAVCAEGRTA